MFASTRLALLGAATLSLLFAPPAQAHFILSAPPNWMSQDSLGLPVKAPPCGDEGGGTATGIITAMRTGQTVTITINETVFHPGHYRVSLASDRSQFVDPPVTAADTPCGSTVVQNPPVLPVLADGLLEHTTAFTAPQTVTIKLPAGVTCTKCTLQVIEFMGEHALNNPGGCFYHHCADISIADAPDDVSDGGDDDLGDMMSVGDGGTSLVEDASASSEPTDMAKRPAAGKAGLPGCSMTPSSAAQPGALFVLPLFMFALCITPRLRFARRKR